MNEKVINVPFLRDDEETARKVLVTCKELIENAGLHTIIGENVSQLSNGKWQVSFKVA
ncbi:MAG: hypothetical protein HFJ17_05070 [Clostridia bacterium]|nr:hypothetical protein [Clostridia bacterium]